MRVILATELQPQETARIRAAFPEVDFEEAYGEDAVLAAAATAEAIFCGRISTEVIAAAAHLKWVHVRSAGVNSHPIRELADRGVLLTNSSGAHGIPIAENILAMMFAFAIRLPTLIDQQRARDWNREVVDREKFELEGQTLLVAGLGDIGGTLAKKAHALGMRVLGVRKRDLPRPEGVDEMIPPGRLLDALNRADHVALCLPLTDETTAFLDEPHLRAMKRTAYVYNAGRGKSIRREALLKALQEGWIAGAGLDVTDPEPLPHDDPLWTFPNVILSQHTSGTSPHNNTRLADIFIENLRKYLEGEPLMNQVDIARGY